MTNKLTDYFSWSSLPRPIIVLAPMAGYTDSAFRQVVKSITPSVICYTELISSDGIFYEGKKTEDLLNFNISEQPLILQLFGKKPEHFAQAAIKAEKLGFAGVDLNFACPARKVVNSCHGGAILKNLPLAEEIIRAVVASTRLPVSIKTRLGWENADGLTERVNKWAQLGVSAVIIHGRTVRQVFNGSANWEPIYEVKKNIKIPITIIGNGDICSLKDFHLKINNLDGVAVGRKTIGNPWLLKEIAENKKDLKGLLGPLRSKVGKSGIKSQTKEISFKKKIPIIIRHAKFAEKSTGKRGIIELRKHLIAYTKGIPGAAELRQKLVSVEKASEVKDVFNTN